MLLFIMIFLSSCKIDTHDLEIFNAPPSSLTEYSSYRQSYKYSCGAASLLFIANELGVTTIPKKQPIHFGMRTQHYC